MSDKPIINFPGNEIDVHWDKRLCIHIGECGTPTMRCSRAGASPGACRMR
jgi:uncharacterized Fe-S cluster protein YjdI